MQQVNLFDTQTHEPTLSSSAMLVGQSIGIWEGTRVDRKVGEEITSSKQARRGTAKVQKQLLPNCTELAAIKQHRNACRTYHRDHTLPWSNSGMRLITVAQYFEYNRIVTEQQQEFSRLVEVFLNVYNIEVAKAQTQMTALGNLFNSEDYPTEDQLRSKFHFDLSYMPLPETGDFRVDIPNEAKNVLKESYDKMMQEQLAGAMNEIWERLAESLTNMSKRLDYNDGEKPTGFRDTLVTNVTDTLDMMKKCNVANDPEMERVRQELSRTLSNVTADGLRERHHLRQTVKQNVDRVIKNLPTLEL